ncbi:MAG: DUF3422 domain-containing protein [Bauldia sp.]|nr:DUF3422 domain-containing protein [Bauldia sp.]
MLGVATEHAAIRPRFAEHPLRSFALNEIHARPFPVMATPRLVLHYAFMTDAVGAARSREDLARRCDLMKVEGPVGENANHHVVESGGVRLRWETHSEFTTYTWDLERPLDDGPLPDFFGEGFQAPGPLMVALRIDLVEDTRPTELILQSLAPASTAVSALRDGRAIGATDFQVGDGRMTRILLIDRGLYPQEVGPLVQRVVELETYRTLALLGLPEARRLQPEVSRIEAGLRSCTDRIGHAPSLSANRQLLEDLTQLAAELEASSAASAFRFGASRAYYEIVTMRLTALREGTLDGYTRWSSFLERRLAPAMRTCQTLENRQADLSRRLERAANLLRTRIDVELEQQNRQLLSSMNRRARLQLRLQQWVEGLSVAAVSYYVIGLINYIAKGVYDSGVNINPELVTAIAVVPVVLGIWMFVRFIRARHSHDPDEHA